MIFIQKHSEVHLSRIWLETSVTSQCTLVPGHHKAGWVNKSVTSARTAVIKTWAKQDWSLSPSSDEFKFPRQLCLSFPSDFRFLGPFRATLGCPFIYSLEGSCYSALSLFSWPEAQPAALLASLCYLPSGPTFSCSIQSLQYLTKGKIWFLLSAQR